MNQPDSSTPRRRPPNRPPDRPDRPDRPDNRSAQPRTRRSTRRRTPGVEHIDTTPMTAEQRDRAVAALAALIEHWKTTRQRPADDPPDD